MAKTKKNKKSGSCYESHPALSLGGGLVVYGGSCIRPVHGDADVYIGFDQGMTSTCKGYPWESGDEIYFPIMDRHAPENSKDFLKLVQWTVEQLQVGKKIHAGCIGGHGRTGLFFTALVARLLPEEKDAIGYVRNSYCTKAVESESQVKFLSKHFGVKEVSGTDYHYSPKKSQADLSFDSMPTVTHINQSGPELEATTTGEPLFGKGNIWAFE